MTNGQSSGPLSDRLIDLFEQLYLLQRLSGCSETTPLQYHVNLRHFDHYLATLPEAQREPGTARLSDLTDARLTGAMAWLSRQPLSDGRKRSPVTVNKLRHHIVALWNFLARKHVVPIWPDVRAWAEPERTLMAWLQPELQRLWMHLAGLPGQVCGMPASDWWLALHCVMWDTGERIGALRQIQWADMSLDTGWLVVRAELRKGKRKDAPFQLHSSTVDVLRRIRREPNEVIFPWDRCHTALWTKYTRILKEGGLPHCRKSKFHRMRKSVASFFEAAGGDATKLLRHSDRKTTEAYLDPRIVPQQQAIDKLFRIESPRKDSSV